MSVLMRDSSIFSSRASHRTQTALSRVTPRVAMCLVVKSALAHIPPRSQMKQRFWGFGESPLRTAVPLIHVGDTTNQLNHY